MEILCCINRNWIKNCYNFLHMLWHRTIPGIEGDGKRAIELWWDIISIGCNSAHDDITKWNFFPRYWPFVPGIHQSPVNPHTQRPVTRGFDVFFDLCLNKRLSKQSWGWWFEMPSHLLWRHCNDKSKAWHIMAWKFPFPCYWPYLKGTNGHWSIPLTKGK